MNLVAVTRSEQDTALLDPWTIVHFAIGLGAGLLDINGWIVGGIAAGHELLERRPQTMKFWKSKPETIGNVTIDMATVMLGWYLGKRYNRTGPDPSETE